MNRIKLPGNWLYVRRKTGPPTERRRKRAGKEEPEKPRPSPREDPHLWM